MLSLTSHNEYSGYATGNHLKTDGHVKKAVWAFHPDSVWTDHKKVVIEKPRLPPLTGDETPTSSEDEQSNKGKGNGGPARASTWHGNDKGNDKGNVKGDGKGNGKGDGKAKDRNHGGSGWGGGWWQGHGEEDTWQTTWQIRQADEFAEIRQRMAELYELQECAGKGVSYQDFNMLWARVMKVEDAVKNMASEQREHGKQLAAMAGDMGKMLLSMTALHVQGAPGLDVAQTADAAPHDGTPPPPAESPGVGHLEPAPPPPLSPLAPPPQDADTVAVAATAQPAEAERSRTQSTDSTEESLVFVEGVQS